jgi:ABC-type glutathione transport system ATPase component
MDPLLALDLGADYGGRADVLRSVRLEVHAGEALGLVGQSGSGKSTLALAILGLLGFKGGQLRGEILFRGRDLARLKERELARLRGRDIALVSQSPLAALNPALRIGAQLREAWSLHAPGRRQEGQAVIERVLREVSLPCDAGFLARFPRELSVGQAQRVVIAMAVLHGPALLVADEPTSSLDAITQAEVLRLLEGFRRQGMAILYISHDLASVASFCGRVAILHEGAIVETGSPERIFGEPRHPYTRRLIEAMPRLNVPALAALECAG